MDKVVNNSVSYLETIIQGIAVAWACTFDSISDYVFFTLELIIISARQRGRVSCQA